MKKRKKVKQSKQKKTSKESTSMVRSSDASGSSEPKTTHWGVSTGDVSINQNDFPSGKGSVHVNASGGGYTLSVSGFDYDGFPRVSRWYDDD